MKENWQSEALAAEASESQHGLYAFRFSRTVIVSPVNASTGCP